MGNACNFEAGYRSYRCRTHKLVGAYAHSSRVRVAIQERGGPVTTGTVIVLPRIGVIYRGLWLPVPPVTDREPPVTTRLTRLLYRLLSDRYKRHGLAPEDCTEPLGLVTLGQSRAVLVGKEPTTIPPDSHDVGARVPF